MTLTEVQAAWRMVERWAGDEITFLDLERELSSLGVYDYAEWKEVFKKIEVASDPSEEHPVSPVNIVVEEAKRRGISLLDNDNAANASGTHSSSSARSRGGGGSRKRRKLAMNNYLDLAAEENEEDDEDELDDELRQELEHLRQPGRSGMQVFASDINDIADRYTTETRSRPLHDSPASPQTRCYYMDFHSEYTARYLFEYLEPRMTRVLVIPWLPRRLYVESPGRQEIWRAISPTHRDIVRDIILVPSADAGRIFATRPALPCPGWVRIQKGKYRRDIGYVFQVLNDTVDILVVPRERPYDSSEEKKLRTRALFDYHIAHDAHLDLTAISNTRGIVAFRCGDCDYFVGLLRLSIKSDDLKRVVIPPPEEILLFGESGVDRPFIEQTCTLFSSQFWAEGDVVRSSSPELLGQRAKVVVVDLESQSVELCFDNQTYQCSLLEQRRVFSVGEQVRILVGADRGHVGIVTAIWEDENEVTISNVNSERQASTFFLETFHPDMQWTSHNLNPTLAATRLPQPEQHASLQLGDLARIVDGPHRGAMGNIVWINDNVISINVPEDENDDQVNPEQNSQGELAAAHISKVVSTPPANLLSFNPETGYDVSVGDEVRVARGPFWGRQGVVRQLHSKEARLQVVFSDGFTATVPIMFCVKFANFIQREANRMVGKEVWVISGEFKGCRATLNAVGRESSLISLYGHPALNIANHAIVSPSGVLLTGRMLDGGRLRDLMARIRSSFASETATVHKTPPPSPRASSSIVLPSDEDSAWTVTLADVVETPLQVIPDPYGQVAWLFNDKFCDFANYHLAFNVDLGFQHGSFKNRVARTTCPDRFCGPSGPAPEGHVSVTVPGHNRGSGKQPHFIPAKFLKPALPSGSGVDKYALILVGEHVGRILPIKKYRRKKDVLLGESWYACNDICPAYRFVR